MSLSSQSEYKLYPAVRAERLTPASLDYHGVSQVCPSRRFSPCLTLGTCPHRQVKRNLLNVSYRIAQYTDVISDLRREIEHLKSKIEKQDKEKSGPSVLDIQGSAVSGLRLQQALPGAIPLGASTGSSFFTTRHGD